jgi:hypothetical protein
VDSPSLLRIVPIKLRHAGLVDMCGVVCYVNVCVKELSCFRRVVFVVWYYWDCQKKQH